MSCIKSFGEGSCKECGQPFFGSVLKTFNEHIPAQYHNNIMIIPEDYRVDFHCANGFLIISPVIKEGTVDGQAYSGSMWEISLTTAYESVRRFPVMEHGKEFLSILTGAIDMVIRLHGEEEAA